MAKTHQASGRHQAHKGGRDGALEQALQAAAPLIIPPGFKAGLAIACSFAAHGAHQLSGTTTGRRRSAIRLVKGTQPCKVSEI
jgi:hypothetical protein